MYITKQKQTHRYREQTSGYQWGERRDEGQGRGRGLSSTTTIYKVDNQPVHIIQHRERQIPYDFAYMWNLRNKTNEQT